jgi:hypothetical protein
MINNQSSRKKERRSSARKGASAKQKPSRTLFLASLLAPASIRSRTHSTEPNIEAYISAVFPFCGTDSPPITQRLLSAAEIEKKTVFQGTETEKFQAMAETNSNKKEKEKREQIKEEEHFIAQHFETRKSEAD